MDVEESKKGSEVKDDANKSGANRQEGPEKEEELSSNGNWSRFLLDFDVDKSSEDGDQGPNS